MASIRQEEVNDELLPLLKSDRTDVRYQTANFFLQLTSSSKGLLLLYNPQCLEGIANLLDDADANIVEIALKTLINLSAEESLASEITFMIKPANFVQNVIYYVLEEESVHADLGAQLLSNLTRSEKCARKITDIMLSNAEISFARLVQVFCTVGYNHAKANLDYLGPFLANLTQIENTRKYILDKKNCIVQRLLTFTDHAESQVRRQGIVATLRNCCMQHEHHDWLLSVDVDILPRLLLPLAGPEEFDEDDVEKLPDQLQYLEPDKKREPVPEIRRMLLEAVFSLCATKSGRKQIKDKNTYIIIRELDKWNKDKEVALAIEKLITILIGDEPSAENLMKVDVPEKVQQTINQNNEESLMDAEENS